MIVNQHVKEIRMDIMVRPRSTAAAVQIHSWTTWDTHASIMSGANATVLILMPPPPLLCLPRVLRRLATTWTTGLSGRSAPSPASLVARQRPSSTGIAGTDIAYCTNPGSRPCVHPVEECDDQVPPCWYISVYSDQVSLHTFRNWLRTATTMRRRLWLGNRSIRSTRWRGRISIYSTWDGRLIAMLFRDQEPEGQPEQSGGSWKVVVAVVGVVAFVCVSAGAATYFVANRVLDNFETTV